MVRAPSLTQELPYAVAMTKKKKKKMVMVDSRPKFKDNNTISPLIMLFAVEFGRYNFPVGEMLL